jgi:AAA+ ATPase superfamily predicted ATPase
MGHIYIYCTHLKDVCYLLNNFKFIQFELLIFCVHLKMYYLCIVKQHQKLYFRINLEIRTDKT